MYELHKRTFRVVITAFSAQVIAVTCEESSRPSRYLAALAIVSLHVTLTFTRRTCSGYENVVGHKVTQCDIVIQASSHVRHGTRGNKHGTVFTV